MKKLLLLTSLLILTACSGKPEKVHIPDPSLTTEQIKLTKEAKAGGVWIATSAGKLLRTDLKRPKESALNISRIAPDVALFNDKNEGIFMLTRMGSDSLQHLTGAKGSLAKEIAVPDSEFNVPANPQHAARDAKGRVWIVSMNSNFVHIFDKQMNNKIRSIRLPIASDADKFIEPSFVIQANEDEMVVFTQRIKRVGWNWTPEEESGFAVIDINTFEIKKVDYIPVPNVLEAFKVDNDIKVIGSGALNNDPINAVIGTLSTDTYELVDEQRLNHRILDSSISESGELTYIAWYREEKKSCIVYGDLEFLCKTGGFYEDGYIFNKIEIAGDLIFISYSHMENSQIWFAKTDGTTPFPPQNVRGTILSITKGP